jgi:aryl-alcohol dehydrogenase-like predicted oxidoreductase
LLNRRLGRTGWRVSEVGCGTWQLGGTMWGEVTESCARQCIDAALDAGISFFDTALAYGHGRSETVLGQALAEAGERDRVRVATKVPPMNWKWPASTGVPIRDVFPPHWITECALRSMENLGGDPLDLLQLHVWTDDWLADTEWLDTLSALRESGTVQAIGISVNDHDPSSALDVTRSGRIDTIQVIYNVFDQGAENGLFEAAQQADVGIIGRVPLDEGSLAGNLTVETEFAETDMRRSYFRGDRLEQTVRRVERMRPLLEAESQCMAEGAVRFCLSHPALTTVIVGSTNPAHIREVAEASDAGPLDASVRLKLKSHSWPRNFYPA